MGVSLVAANLATACIECLFYGILFVLSVASTYILAHRRRTAEGQRQPPRSALRSLIVSPMFVGSLGLFIGNTMHWIVGLIRLFQAFVYFEGGANPTAFYLDLSRKTYIAQLGALSFCIILGDAILIYRLWVVWAYNNFVIIIPLLSLVGYVGVTYQTSRFRVGDNVNQVSAAGWITPLWALTICTNFYSTALIAWRVWRAHLAVNKSVSSWAPMRAIVTLVESAALYTAWNVFYYVTYQLQSELQFVWNQTMPAVCGIAFMLINVRVGLRPAVGTPAASNGSSSEIAFASRLTTEHSSSRLTTEHSCPIRLHDLESEAASGALVDVRKSRQSRLHHQSVVLERSDMAITITECARE